MKLSIDTSNFSFRFVGLVLGVVALILVFFSTVVGLVLLISAVTFYIQKYKYIIPHSPAKVTGQVEKTLNSLGLQYQRTSNDIRTKTVTIRITKCLFFVILIFKFDKVYTVQGKYLAETISKYQRYI